MRIGLDRFAARDFTELSSVVYANQRYDRSHIESHHTGRAHGASGESYVSAAVGESQRHCPQMKKKGVTRMAKKKAAAKKGGAKKAGKKKAAKKAAKK